MDGTMQGYQAQVSDTQFTDSNMQMSPYSETQRQQQQYLNFPDMRQQAPSYANPNLGQPGLPQSSPIEERKALILAKLQEERELRR